MLNYVKSGIKGVKAFVAIAKVCINYFLTTLFCNKSVFCFIFLCSILKKSSFGLNLYSCKLDLHVCKYSFNIHLLLFITRKYTIINASLKLTNAKIHSFYSINIP